MTTVDTADAAARRLIATGLDRTLFVEAGAGSGKTHSLVARVVATVLDGGVPLRHIAAVTFTEKAAAELRDRLRVAFERDGSPAAQEALDELDSAAIGTLHSFARRILTEHPIEAGLPPLLEVLDEVASGVAFDERYVNLRTAMLDDPALTPALLLALSAGMRLDDLRSLALTFTDNWDLIPARVLATAPPALPTVDITPLLETARWLAEQRGRCRADDDKLLPNVEAVADWAARLAAAADDPARVALLRGLPEGGWNLGRRENWEAPVTEVRAAGRRLVRDARALRTQVLDAALRTLARRIGASTLADAQARREEGRLEFHDLLVLTRDLLRHPVHGASVRAALQQRYRRLLLDEFQDTDPIQIELAVRIAGGAAADAPQWTDVVVPPASLFVVGDPKQSIYRFRRADIGTYLTAQQHLGEQVLLDTNFRTGSSIVDWINHTFGRLILPEPGSQPQFHPLRAVRPDAPVGPAVVRLGTRPHSATTNAGALREHEAADVVAAVRTALAQRWQVEAEPGPDGQRRWRDITLPDIAILLPARTALPQLEAALDEAGIRYHSEASSLVYRTAEVRELLAAARAVDDPSDQLSLVTALRSRLFGCGDDDLWTWRSAGGSWHILRQAPESIPADHPVAQAIAWLRRLHYDSAWLSPSEVLGRIVEGRRMLETAVADRHARDIWRRLRFVVDQARAWSEVEHGGLRSYLSWVTRQSSDNARVAEAVLPETDTRALRIMTIHAAKGMEFPMVIVAGMTSQPFARRGGVDVLWPPTGGYELRLRRDFATASYDVAAPIDEQMDDHERIRLLYVACTRARDHLVVSTHRREPAGPAWRRAETRLTSAELLAQGCADAPGMVELTPVPDLSLAQPAPEVAPPPDYPQWSASAAALRARTARPSAVSASQFEGSAESATADSARIRAAATDVLGEPVDPGLAKDARDLELPPWNKGRYGTAIGRAVHGVLQTVDLRTGDGLDGAVAAQALAEGVGEFADVVARLARSALAADLIRRAATRRHWRETYVGTTLPSADGDHVVEGVVDLLYRDDDGLVLVDYKTDAVPVQAIPSRVDYYRPQMAVYALALQAAVGEPVRRCVLLFLNPAGAHAAEVTGLDQAIAALPAAVLPRPGAAVLPRPGQAR